MFFKLSALQLLIFFICIVLSFLIELLKSNAHFISSVVEFSCVFWCVVVLELNFVILKSVLENLNSEIFLSLIVIVLPSYNTKILLFSETSNLPVFAYVVWDSLVFDLSLRNIFFNSPFSFF